MIVVVGAWCVKILGSLQARRSGGTFGPTPELKSPAGTIASEAHC